MSPCLVCNIESVVFPLPVHPCGVHMPDIGPGVARPEFPDQGFNQSFGPFHFNLDFSRGQISDPSAKLHSAGCFHDKIPVTNTLDGSGNNDVCRSVQ